MEAEANYFKNEIARNKKEGEELKSDSKLLEKFARERYLMKRQRRYFLLVEDSLEKK